MKKKFLFLAVVVTSKLFAQNPIPNPGFENWTNNEPDIWATENLLVPGTPFIYPSSSAHSGNYSVKGSPQDVSGTLTSPMIWQCGGGNSCFTISQAYTCITFWYKCNLLSGDDFNMALNFWDSSGTWLADADMNLQTSVPNWTFASIPIIYWQAIQPPYQVNLEFNLNNYLISNAGNLNSWFEVDDVEFCNSTVGINHLPDSKTSINCYPNPVSGTVNVSIKKQNLNQVTFILKDILEQTVFTMRENSLNNNYSKTFDLSFLSKGIYLLDINIDGERTVKKIVKE